MVVEIWFIGFFVDAATAGQKKSKSVCVCCVWLKIEGVLEFWWQVRRVE